MNLQEAYYVAEIVVGIAVITSIVFVAIELRQNTYLLRRSMADERENRLNWLMETICTDQDFREFFRKAEDEFDQLDEDERFRATCLGVRVTRPMLHELVAYYDGHISPDEFKALQVNIKRAKNRPHVRKAYELSKDYFPKKVQEGWEELMPADEYKLQ